MEKYELTFLVRGDDDQAGVPDLIAQLGGRILFQETPLRRKLAYPIKNEASALFLTYQFEIEPTKIAQLNSKLLSNTAILRHLLIAGGIRKPLVEAAPKRLKAKDLEVPASVLAGLPAEAPAIKEPSAPVTTEAPPTPPAEVAAHELTAQERQQKLEEKLKDILGKEE